MQGTYCPTKSPAAVMADRAFAFVRSIDRQGKKMDQSIAPDLPGHAPAAPPDAVDHVAGPGKQIAPLPAPGDAQAIADQSAAPAAPAPKSLTQHQARAWQCRASGLTYAQGAHAMGISPQAFERLVGACLRKAKKEQLAREKKQATDSLLIPFDLAAPEGIPDRAAQILAHYRQGLTGEQIARLMGVTPEAIYMYLLRHCRDAWQDHQAARSLTRLERATERLESAEDAIALGRAREEIKAAQWALERVCRRIYGPAVELRVTGGIDIRTAIAEARARVSRTIEGDSAPVA